MCQWLLEGLGPTPPSSSSLLSNNFVMTGRGLGEQAQGVASAADMVPRVEQAQEELIVLHCSMWFMAHLRVGLWVQASVSTIYCR